MSEKILLTGSSGFLGLEIYNYLKSQKFEIFSLGRSINCDIICDLSKEVPTCNQLNFDYVIHAAGKAHIVPKTKKEIEDFHNVNVNGTLNLLNSLKDHLPKTLIFISSVAVYGLDSGNQIDESYPLIGVTPYAKSKIEAEKIVIDFGEKFNINIVIIRPPLITGKSPSGNLGDLMSAIKKGFYFRIGDGSAKRSMVSSLDIAKIIPTLFKKQGIYNLTDGIHPSFKDIDTYIGDMYNKSIILMPLWFVRCLAYIGNIFPFFPLNSTKFTKMTKSLTFSDDKAVNELGWQPESALKQLK